MAPDTVLVTGAGGFIGGRLAQRIALGEAYDVRPLLHRFSGPGAMRLARLPVDIAQGSVTDPSQMAAVMDGCDAVVHCAVGSKDVTISGTETLLKAAIDADVDDFIHLSSASVHGHDSHGTLREESPKQPDTAYAHWKLTAEERIDELSGDADLSPTVFRPFIVYGPGSQFVTEPVETIQAGAVLAGGGSGAMNQIYVDNLVDAVLLALENPQSRGETFLLSDNEDLTWRRYYSDLGDLLSDHPPFRDVSRRSVRLQNSMQYATDSVVPPFRAIKDIVTSEEVQQTVATEARQIPWVMGMYSLLPSTARESLQSHFFDDGAPLLPDETVQENSHSEATYAVPSQRYAKMHTSPGRVSNRKVKELLGWEQRIAYPESIDLLDAWISYADVT